jgi:hypothetical protein
MRACCGCSSRIVIPTAAPPSVVIFSHMLLGLGSSSGALTKLTDLFLYGAMNGTIPTEM